MLTLNFQNQVTDPEGLAEIDGVSQWYTALQSASKLRRIATSPTGQPVVLDANGYVYTTTK